MKKFIVTYISCSMTHLQHISWLGKSARHNPALHHCILVQHNEFLRNAYIMKQMYQTDCRWHKNHAWIWKMNACYSTMLGVCRKLPWMSYLNATRSRVNPRSYHRRRACERDRIDCTIYADEEANIRWWNAYAIYMMKIMKYISELWCFQFRQRIS